MVFKRILVIHLFLMLSVSGFAQKRSLSSDQQKFFAQLYPGILASNKQIMKEREHVLKIEMLTEKGKNIDYEDVVFLNRIAQKYKVQEIPNADHLSPLVEVLKKRVDIIPIDMVLAQAAIESGWGSSRFAKEGNNYFGIHCYGKDCGMKPANVSTGSFMVKSYEDKNECINDYMRILNSHRAYAYFRELRYQERLSGNDLNAAVLAQGLEKYSERGMEYVGMVKFIANKYVPDNMESLRINKTIETAQAIK